MNNPFRIFTSPLFGNVRAAYIDGVAWFAGKDVATALGYRDTKYAVKMHVAKEDRKQWRIPTPSSGLQEAIIINESGLYSLVLSSKLPAAQQFKHWIIEEVIKNCGKTLLPLADKFSDPQLRDKVLVHVINQLCGRNIF